MNYTVQWTEAGVYKSCVIANAGTSENAAFITALDRVEDLTNAKLIAVVPGPE